MKKRFLSLLFFISIFFALTILFSINVNAEKVKDIYLANPDTKIDISKGDINNNKNSAPPLIVVQGSEITYNDIANMLYYGEQKLYPNYLNYTSQIKNIDGSAQNIFAANASGTSWSSNTVIVTNKSGFTETPIPYSLLL